MVYVQLVNIQILKMMVKLIGTKEDLLKELLDKHRKSDGSYDCIVSGSGGKDSSTVAHILKYKYNMNPLTVTYTNLIHRYWISKFKSMDILRWF